MPTLSRAEKQKLQVIKKRKDEIRELLQYAEVKYGVKGPNLLPYELLYSSLSKRKNPTKKTVDGIFREWLYWKPYVSEESFNQFFIQEMKNLFKNHATATSSSALLRSYIGNKAEIQRILPFCYGTSLDLDGTCLVNGKPK